MNEFFEEERHRCEVRHVLKVRADSRQKMLDYLDLVKQQRGEQSVEKIEKDAREQWNKGNRGLQGDWK